MNHPRHGAPRRWLLLILAVPSIYSLCTLPPLWRDSDGFYQVTAKPGYLTLLQWPPLYCFTARVPLLVGNLLSGTLPRRGRTGHGLPLTDSGVYALLVAQHALLVAVLYRACRQLPQDPGLPQNPGLQVAYAGCFALAAPLYAFANCVGSEALSNVLTLWTGLSCWQTARRPSGPGFVQVLAPLSLGILTRHISALLVLILPVYFLLTSDLLRAQREVTGVTPPGGARPSSRMARSAALFGASLLAGGVAVGIAEGCVAVLCHETRTALVSRMGYAFQWRLDFLTGLPPQERGQVLSKAEHSLQDPVITAGLDAVRTALDSGQPFAPEALFAAMDRQLLADGVSDGQRRRDLVDQKLNRLAAWCLSSAGGAFYRAVARDFVAGISFSPAQIAREPFATTDWLLDQAPRQPALRELQSLRTFQRPPGTLVDLWKQIPYFRFGEFAPLWALAAAAVALGVAAYWGRPGGESRASLGYALSLVVVGLAVTWVNCGLTFLGPRFLLPAYLLFLLAALIAGARLAEPG